jgi:hypothetical protein
MNPRRAQLKLNIGARAESIGLVAEQRAGLNLAALIGLALLFPAAPLVALAGIVIFCSLLMLRTAALCVFSAAASNDRAVLAQIEYAAEALLRRVTALSSLHDVQDGQEVSLSRLVPTQAARLHLPHVGLQPRVIAQRPALAALRRVGRLVIM